MSMSFDIHLNQHSRIARRCSYALLAFCLLLTATAPLALAVKIIVAVVFMVVGVFYTFIKPPEVTLSFDGSAWYIDTRDDVFSSASILSIRDFTYCRVVVFVDADGDYFQQSLWQDQVSTETWRRLSVFHTLHVNR